MNQLLRLTYCPHCGNTGQQLVVHSQKYLERYWSVSDAREHSDAEATYFVAVCQTCKQILVYWALTEADESFDNARLLWPEFGLDDSVPDKVKRIYNEASRIKAIAPNAYAVQIRRALEAICLERGATKTSLFLNLQELATRGEIPKTLVEASDVLRLVGNLGAHASDREVHPLQALSLDKFFRALVEYLYISPKKIQEFRESFEKSKEEANCEITDD